MKHGAGRKPYVRFFRVIEAIVLDKSQKRGKFQPKGDEYILVGYSQESKTYRLWKPETKTVIKTRDVKFFETQSLNNLPNESTFDILKDKIDDSSILQLQPPDTPSEDCSLEKSEREVNGQENNREVVNKGSNELHRDRGRPKLLRTDQRGRPKKVYQTNNALNQDSQTVSEVLNRNDKEA